MKPRMLMALAAAAALTLAACGDDDDNAATATTAAAPVTTAPAATAAPATTAPATTAPATTDAGSDMSAEASGSGAPRDPYCALAQEMANQESQPTPEQLTKAQELAPAEIKDAADLAAPALAAATNMSEFFAIYAQDDIEQAVAEINAYEDANCGTEHGDDSPGEGASRELDADATKVDVVASDYKFDMADSFDAGRTSFVLTNQGHEAHFIEIVKLADGVTLEQAMQTEDPTGMIDGQWGSNIAAPGGEDDEVITIDLTPGNYAALCFIPGPDGTPHAFMGMQKEFTVS